MSTRSSRAFRPDYAIPPGSTLRETLERLGLTQADLAERTGRPKKTINEIVQGKAAITPETSLQLERVLGVPAAMWNNLEHQYRTGLARIAERVALAPHVQWLSQFPLNEMLQRGWIVAQDDRIEMVREVLRFFGVVSPAAWKEVWDIARRATAYRQAKYRTVDFGAIAAWLRQGEIEGRAAACKPYSETGFREALKVIRGLTTTDPRTFCTHIQKLCSAAGVAVVFLPELPRTRTFGAARWLTPDKALIQLSLYRKRDDQLWFSFFHEAAHVLLHGRREVFVDGPDGTSDEQETEANEFARNILISQAAYETFVASQDFSRAAITAFARSVSIAPGIVVGRLQHEGLVQYNQRNDLYRRLKWASSDQ